MSIGCPSNYGIDDIEQMLESTFVPLMPRAEFISNLHLELRKKLTETQAISRDNSKQTLLLAIASVAGSCIMIITSLRALLSLIGVISVISMIKRKSPKKPFSPSQPVAG
jgi:hypothetical protein